MPNLVLSLRARERAAGGGVWGKSRSGYGEGCVKSVEMSGLSPGEGEQCTEPFRVPEVCQEIFSNDFTPRLCS